MLIGLHKMAAERGDGLIPEMLDVLRRSGDALAHGSDRSADLVPFPGRQAEARIAVPPVSNGNNVIAFPIAGRIARR
jgi:hypothetical protein